MTRERVVDLPHGGEPPRLLGVEPLGLLDEALDLVHLLFVLVRHPSRQLGVVDAVLLDRPGEAVLFELLRRPQLRVTADLENFCMPSFTNDWRCSTGTTSWIPLLIIITPFYSRWYRSS